MDLNEVLTAISTVGFPIAAYLMLFVKSWRVDAKQTEAINTNTAAIMNMAESIKMLCTTISKQEE